MRIYLPELDYYFGYYWRTGAELTTVFVPTPEVVNNIDPAGNRPWYLPKASIFELLFNNKYSEETFSYRLKKISITGLPKRIMERIRTIGLVPTFITTDIKESSNLLSITDADIMMLNKLLEYRLGEIPDISNITLDNLDSQLSALILAYLQFMVNYNFEYLLTLDLISEEGNTLNNLFEAYVINEAHRIAKNWEFLIDSHIHNVYPVRQRIVVDQTIEKDKFAPLRFYPFNDLFIYKNGEEQKSSDFQLYDTTGDCPVISWIDSAIKLVDGDVLVVDSYSITKVAPRPVPSTIGLTISPGDVYGQSST